MVAINMEATPSDVWVDFSGDWNKQINKDSLFVHKQHVNYFTFAYSYFWASKSIEQNSQYCLFVFFYFYFVFHTLGQFKLKK